MLNSVHLLGRMAQDPELRSTQTGIHVTSFDLAVPVPSKDKSAPPDYIPIVCWSDQADFACKYLTKGRQVVVDGRLTTRKYTDSEGKNRKVVEVVAHRVFFADAGNGGNASKADDQNSDFMSTAESGFMGVSSDEHLPF